MKSQINWEKVQLEKYFMVTDLAACEAYPGLTSISSCTLAGFTKFLLTYDAW